VLACANMRIRPTHTSCACSNCVGGAAAIALFLRTPSYGR
jgi:hypothetical protein